MRKQIYPLSLFLLLGIGFFLRFLFLTWGFPFFFHPDENNITNAILQLSLKQWNPHFFAYGGLPIYFSFLTSFISSLGKLSFAEVAYSLRLISATLSLLLIPSLFYIGKRLYSQKTGFYAAALSTVSIGFIQFAHFGTFEMWLTFLTLWLFYSTYLLYKNPTIKHI